MQCSTSPEQLVSYFIQFVEQVVACGPTLLAVPADLAAKLHATLEVDPVQAADPASRLQHRRGEGEVLLEHADPAATAHPAETRSAVQHPTERSG